MKIERTFCEYSLEWLYYTARRVSSWWITQNSNVRVLNFFQFFFTKHLHKQSFAEFFFTKKKKRKGKGKSFRRNFLYFNWDKRTVVIKNHFIYIQNKYKVFKYFPPENNNKNIFIIWKSSQFNFSHLLYILPQCVVVLCFFLTLHTHPSKLSKYSSFSTNWNFSPITNEIITVTTFQLSYFQLICNLKNKHKLFYKTKESVLHLQWHICSAIKQANIVIVWEYRKTMM